MEHPNTRTSLTSAVNSVLEDEIALDASEGLLKMLQAFDSMLYRPMTDPDDHSAPDLYELTIVEE